MPGWGIFGHKGPAIFVPDDDPSKLLFLLGVMNSQVFKTLVDLQMAFGSYEVGVLQRTPVPNDLSALDTGLVREAHDLTRDTDRTDETTHAFGRPGLADPTGGSLFDLDRQLTQAAQDRLRRLIDIQHTLDEQVFDLYGLSATDREMMQREASHPNLKAAEPDDEESEDEEAIASEDLPLRVQNLLMWCAGVAFGRWNVLFALQPELLPALQEPFDSLPRCAPGALVGTDGLPATRETIASEAWLRARENVLHLPDPLLPYGVPATISEADYPLPIAWDGILVDDPTHTADIVERVRGVLALIWGKRAGAIEQEACDVLGVVSLRDYFRDPRQGFFAFHINRYSKSRRKAPIYWLLQSANRNYAVWLYIHRMDDNTYFTAARNYADAKVNLETSRLEDLRQSLAALDGSAHKRREREIVKQQKVVDEITTFRNRLDEIALRGLTPDLNDGVLISIAPLWELVPWKESGKMWQELADGKYEWSTMSQKMRQHGLIK